MELGVYRSKDPVDNLRIKVNLRKVTASSSDADDGHVARSYDTFTQAVSWQQKLFSRAELEKYRSADNCTTTLEKDYHQRVGQLDAAANTERQRLFTYVNNDDYLATQHADAAVLAGDAAAEPSFLVRRMNEVRQKHGVRHSEPARAGAQPHLEDIVTTTPTERDKARRVIDTPFQIMYIMADLSKRDADHDPDRDDVMLCSVKIDDNGTLEASPAFNGDRPPFRIHTRHGDIYEYTLVHSSTRMTPRERELEAEMLNELNSKHSQLLEKRVGKVFDELPFDRDIVAYHVLGEVVSAFNFEYDDLYIHLLVELPQGWSWASGKEPSNLVTQISRASNAGGDDGVYKFAFPFELDLVLECDAGEEALLYPPKILFQVNALDYFGRHRPEGYGQLSMPLQPGKHAQSVPSWRPAGPPVTGQMRRHFIGGAPELEDLSYVGIPAEQHANDSVLSRLGFQTDSSGTVDLRFHVVRQRQLRGPVDRTARPRSPQKTFKMAQALELSKSTMSVLSAFKRAHSRMQASKK